MNKLTKAALLALTAASLATLSASAANVSTGPTDLILSFQVTDNTGTGSASNLEVDLGDFSLFTSSGPTLTLNQLSVSDLVSTYGSNWATRGDLAFNVAGLTSTTSNNFDTTYSAANPQQSSNLSGPTAKIGGLVGGLGGTAQSANSTKSGVVSNSQGNSFTQEVTDAGALDGDYGYFAPNGVTQLNGTGSIDLYSFTQKSVARGQTNPATLLGAFGLTSGGVLTYTPAAVPEPSAYALGICAALLFLVLRRRASVA
jgi:hypothetical protein